MWQKKLDFSLDVTKPCRSGGSYPEKGSYHDRLIEQTRTKEDLQKQRRPRCQLRNETLCQGEMSRGCFAEVNMLLQLKNTCQSLFLVFPFSAIFLASSWIPAAALPAYPTFLSALFLCFLCCCCFSILFAAAFLVAGGVASSVSSLILLLGIFRFLFLTFSRRRKQRWLPLRRQPQPRGRGRGPKCPPFCRACCRAAAKPLGQQEYGIQNTVLLLKEARHSRKSKSQKQSVALKEEYI